MVVVARDGIEPPTPAFSGPRSTTELSGLGWFLPTRKPRSPLSGVVSKSPAWGWDLGHIANAQPIENVFPEYTNVSASRQPHSAKSRAASAGSQDSLPSLPTSTILP